MKRKPNPSPPRRHRPAAGAAESAPRHGLARVLSKLGVCSRTQAQAFVRAGRVRRGPWRIRSRHTHERWGGWIRIGDFAIADHAAPAIAGKMVGMTTRIKICGITRLEDAILAIELGADAIGLNFFAGPRRVDPEVARTIHRALRIDAPANARPVQIVVLCVGSRRHFPDSLAWHEIASIFPPPDVYQIYADD